jgi:hypothetical protein
MLEEKKDIQRIEFKYYILYHKIEKN